MPKLKKSSAEFLKENYHRLYRQIVEDYSDLEDHEFEGLMVDIENRLLSGKDDGLSGGYFNDDGTLADQYLQFSTQSF